MFPGSLRVPYGLNAEFVHVCSRRKGSQKGRGDGRKEKYHAKISLFYYFNNYIPI